MPLDVICGWEAFINTILLTTLWRDLRHIKACNTAPTQKALQVVEPWEAEILGISTLLERMNARMWGEQHKHFKLNTPSFVPGLLLQYNLQNMTWGLKPGKSSNRTKNGSAKH